MSRTSMITDCRKAIVRATSEEELLQKLCDTIVDLGGYDLAWIGLLQHDLAKTGLSRVYAGKNGLCFDPSPISTAEEDPGFPPVEAMRTGKISIHCGIPAGQSLCGYRGCIALPLRSESEDFGALVLCSSIESAVDESQAEELQELADDLAFGLATLRTRAELKTALQDLEHRSLELRTLASELTQAEERERKRLAQALHDDLQQLLVAAKFCADTLSGGIRDEHLHETAGHLSQFLVQAIESARSLSFELSPPILHDAGLAKALSYLGRRMEATHGLAVSVQADEGAEPETEEIRVILFQSTRELLFNVVKHAQVKAAGIEMRRFMKDFVQITVSDSGIGFDPETCRAESSQNGFGLFSIRGRLDLVGGRLEFQSAPGAGSRFTMTAPISKLSASLSPSWDEPPVRRLAARPRGGLIRAIRKAQEGKERKLR